MSDVPWDNIFKLSASAAASDFCEQAKLGIDVHIPHRKYQVKPHLSPWFSTVCAAVIVHSSFNGREWMCLCLQWKIIETLSGIIVLCYLISSKKYLTEAVSVTIITC